MLTGRHGAWLDDWIAAAEADDQPELHRHRVPLTT
jgi:hypothetical protein